MKVRTNKWHYWFYTFMMDFPPDRTNLCRYFWRTAWGMFLTAFFLTTAVTIATVLAVQAYLHPYHALAIVGLIFCAIGGFYVAFKVDERRAARVPKEPGLVGSYIAARKAKVCPIIEFENGHE